MANVKSAKATLMIVTEKQFRKYLARDSHCLHCGLQDDTLVPQHRVTEALEAQRLNASLTPQTLLPFALTITG